MVNSEICNVVAVFVNSSPIFLGEFNMNDTIKVNINAPTILCAPHKPEEAMRIASNQRTQFAFRYYLLSKIFVINNIDISIYCIALACMYVVHNVVT